MPLFRNLGGPHTTEDGTNIPKGGMFRHDNPALCEIFVNKFELVPDEEAPPQPTVSEEAMPPPMVDVTADFPAAVAGGLVVRKGNQGWFVFDGDAPCNEKPLKKRDVAEFVKNYLQSE